MSDRGVPDAGPGGSAALTRYLREMRQYARPSREEERQLREDLLAGKDGAVERLAVSALAFVVKIAREYRDQGLPLEDLINEGNVGLMEAARRFDPGRELRFTTYAVWWIRKAILEALSRARLVSFPTYQTKRLRRIRDTEAGLRSALGRAPTRDEIAGRLSEKKRLLDDTLRLRPIPLSLSATIRQEGERTLESVLADRQSATAEANLMAEERRRGLAEALDALPGRERLVLTLRYGLSSAGTLKLREIARQLGLSRERIRQIEGEARARLRRLMEKGRSPAGGRRGSRQGIRPGAPGGRDGCPGGR